MDNSFYQNVPIGARVFSHTFSIATQANKNEYRLEENSPLENQRVVGVWLVEAVGTTKDPQGSDIVNNNVLNSSYLTLEEGETNVHRDIPLQLIKKCNDNGHPFPVSINVIQMSQSRVKIGNVAGIVAGQNFVFQFDFVKREK